MNNLQKIKWISTSKVSEVYIVKDTISNKLYILKKFILVNVNTEEEKEHLENEMNVLTQLSHPNIIKLYKKYQSPHHKYLLLQYGNGGTLLQNLEDYKRKYSKSFPEDLVQIFMKQILSGVNYLHTNGIIHRDLKLENIVLKYDNPFDEQNKNLYKATVKIIDFGLCYIPNMKKPISVVGTVKNMSPSIVYNINNSNPKCYDEKVDIWSLGTLCYEMLFLNRLFKDMSNDEMFDSISSANFKISHSISKEARNFLECMLQKDGSKRLSSYQLLNHIFITGDCNKFTKYVKVFVNNPIPIHRCETSNNILLGNKFPQLKTNYHINNRCGECKNFIFDYIYKCKICENFIYCKICFEKFGMMHKHPFEIIIEKNIYMNNKKTISSKNNDKYYNIIFKRKEAEYDDVNIFLDGNVILNKLLEQYLERIKRNDLKGNFINKFHFIYNSTSLNGSLNKKISEIFLDKIPLIYVVEKGL